MIVMRQNCQVLTTGDLGSILNAAKSVVLDVFACVRDYFIEYCPE